MLINRDEVILRHELAQGGSHKVSVAEALGLLQSEKNVVQVHVIGCLRWSRVKRQVGDYNCWVVSQDGERMTEAPRSARGGIDRAFREVLMLNRKKDPGRDLSRWKD